MKTEALLRWMRFSWLVLGLSMAGSTGWAQLSPPVAAPPRAADDDHVVSVTAEFSGPKTAGQAGNLVIKATIKPGWHIYSITQAPGGPVVTKIKLENSASYQLAAAFRASPDPAKKAEPLFDNLVVETHHGTVTWQAPLRLAAGVNPKDLKIKGTVMLQACLGMEQCEMKTLPFEARFIPPAATSPANPR
jgi:hypothetical protein